MSQFGFQSTDSVPPTNGPIFDAEDIGEHGLELLLTAWRRRNVTALVILTERGEKFPLPPEGADRG